MKNKIKTVLFVSPHFDDAVFSAGGYISDLVQSGTKVIVVNVFTSCGEGKNSFSAKQYLNRCKYSSAKELYKQRVIEDTAVLTFIGAESINLGFVEALWRKRTNVKLKGIVEFELRYPTYSWHIARGKIHNEDNDLISQITSELIKIIACNSVNLVVGPQGIGKHVDHLITKQAVINTGFVNILLWDDYPYTVRENYNSRPDLQIKPNWNEKRELMKGYKTQYDAIFPNGLIEQDETFSKYHE